MLTLLAGDTSSSSCSAAKVSALTGVISSWGGEVAGSGEAASGTMVVLRLGGYRAELSNILADTLSEGLIRVELMLTTVVELMISCVLMGSAASFLVRKSGVVLPLAWWTGGNFKGNLTSFSVEAKHGLNDAAGSLKYFFAPGVNVDISGGWK